MAIQKNLRIYSRKVEDFQVFGSDEKVKARKGFAVDRDKKSHSTADNWSKARPWLAPQLDRLALLFDEDAELYEDVPNDPIEIRLLYLERRMRGGRAYKVVTKTGYCYDLREDPLVDALVNCGGATKDGWFKAKFVWAGARLIPVGGSIWESHQAASKRKKTAKIPNKDLVPGTIYETDNTSQLLFLGWVHSARGVNKKKGLWCSWTGENHSYSDGQNVVTHRDPSVEVPEVSARIATDNPYVNGFGRPEVKSSCRVIKRLAGPFKMNGDPIAATRDKGVDKLISEYNNSGEYNGGYGWSSRGRTRQAPSLTRQQWWAQSLNRSGRSYSYYGDPAQMATLTDRTQPIVYDPRLADFVTPAS